MDDPYEPPVNAEISMKNHDMTIQQSVDVIMKKLQEEGEGGGGMCEGGRCEG